MEARVTRDVRHAPAVRYAPTDDVDFVIVGAGAAVCVREDGGITGALTGGTTGS